MPELVPYVYRRGEAAVPRHGVRCPACGGKVRAQTGTTALGICLGCRELVVLRNRDQWR